MMNRLHVQRAFEIENHPSDIVVPALPRSLMSVSMPSTDEIKAHGVHYTPPELGLFLARRMWNYMPHDRHNTVLDPACGDGNLLASMASIASEAGSPNLLLLGIDRDAVAVEQARLNLSEFRDISQDLQEGDFLERAVQTPVAQMYLLDALHQSNVTNAQVDAVISNPPYVRTQVLGAEVAQSLAAKYDLSGRVDLYHAFTRAMTNHLRPGGVLGLLCSNRFLSTQGGASLRALLRSEYELCEIHDLGDTKLFAAAVLPAIIIARKRNGHVQDGCVFTRTYERRDVDAQQDMPQRISVLAAIEGGTHGLVRVSDLIFEVERGTLSTSRKDTEPWVMTSPSRQSWLDTVAKHTACTFKEIAPIRVGIKTTADTVFIRDDWETLPEELRPERELLKPLITHHVAHKWRSLPIPRPKSVLYPHTVLSGKRATVNIEDYPRAKAYLESHHDRLASRKYVIDSGRKWYEIWVPQQPGEWHRPKIVFPDISDTPRFFLDDSGSVTNGDCYWMALNGKFDRDRAYVLLAVANSTFALKFYDAVCANRLYAGRRRFITQYIERFPLPKLDTAQTQRIVEAVSELVKDTEYSREERAVREATIDDLVWQSFGLSKETAW